jgi:hypothetical protein
LVYLSIVSKEEGLKMGIKESIKGKYESYKKKHNEEVAYNSIIEKKATAARREAYANEYTKASASAARAKARADVSGGGSKGGFFSTIVKNNSNSFSGGFGLPQGGSVIGNNPLFGGNSTPRIPRKARRRAVKPQRAYYYAPVRHIRRPQRRKIYYAKAPKRHHRRTRSSPVQTSSYGTGSIW